MIYLKFDKIYFTCKENNSEYVRNGNYFTKLEDIIVQ